MGFMDSYKKLDRLCSDVYGYRNGLSAYIESMKRINDGAYHTEGWKEDLKQLKHYRWIRNRIAHDPGCTEKTMCRRGDEEWLEDFYIRVKSHEDPLAVYYECESRRKKKALKFMSVILAVMLVAVMIYVTVSSR